MITYTTTIPPPIHQYFSSRMLSTPVFRQDAEYIKRYADWVMSQLKGKYRKFPGTLHKLNQQYQTFMELYERAKTQERESEEKLYIKTKDMFYGIELPNQDDRRVFERLLHRKKTSLRYRKNNAV